MQLYVQFMKIFRILSSGFVIYWKCNTGTIQVGRNGRIIQKGYENAADITWHIWARCEKSIVIRSKFFETEQTYDYLKINDRSFSGTLKQRIFKLFISVSFWYQEPYSCRKICDIINYSTMHNVFYLRKSS
jgi:hypothetical protein